MKPHSFKQNLSVENVTYIQKKTCTFHTHTPTNISKKTYNLSAA